MKFPDDWPANCPPDDAADAEGDVFRLVKSDQPTAEDFKTFHELGTRINAPACLRCGLSVFRNKADVEHLHQAYPKLGKFIARGTLKPEHGRTRATGRPTHTTWWSYENVDRAGILSDIEEIV